MNLTKVFAGSRASMLLDPFCTASRFPTSRASFQIFRGSTRRVPAGASMLLDPFCTARVISDVSDLISKPLEGVRAAYPPEAA